MNPGSGTRLASPRITDFQTAFETITVTNGYILVPRVGVTLVLRNYQQGRYYSNHIWRPTKGTLKRDCGHGRYRPYSRWLHLTTTTRIYFVFAFLFNFNLSIPLSPNLHKKTTLKDSGSCSKMTSSAIVLFCSRVLFLLVPDPWRWPKRSQLWELTQFFQQESSVRIQNGKWWELWYLQTSQKLSLKIFPL